MPLKRTNSPPTSGLGKEFKDLPDTLQDKIIENLGGSNN